MSNKNFKNQNRHNYNQYANKKESTPVEEKEEIVETAEEVTEAVETAEEVTEAVETVETDEEVEEEEEKVLEAAPLYGIVNCARLNVRRGPSIDTKSVCIVESGSKLEIEYFNDEWLKVVTEDGIFGYCMKKFVDEK